MIYRITQQIRTVDKVFDRKTLYTTTKLSSARYKWDMLTQGHEGLDPDFQDPFKYHTVYVRYVFSCMDDNKNYLQLENKLFDKWFLSAAEILEAIKNGNGLEETKKELEEIIGGGE